MRHITVLIFLWTLQPCDAALLPQQSCAQTFELSASIEDLLSKADQGDPLSEEVVEFLDLEKRVLAFLEVVPNRFLDLIGLMFSHAAQVDVDYPHLSQDALERVRREQLFRRVRPGVSDADWEVVSPFFADQALMSFLVEALKILPIGTARMRHFDDINQLRFLAILYLKKSAKQRPPPEQLLTGSRLLREAFVRVARSKNKRFQGDLSEPKQQKAALKMLAGKCFGSIDQFWISWLQEAFDLRSEYFAKYLKHRGITYEEYSESELEQQMAYYSEEIQYADLFEDDAVENYFDRWNATVMFNNPFYSAEQLRAAISQALSEHHQIVLELLTEAENQAQANKLYATYVPPPARASHVPVAVEHELSSFITGLLPLEQLQANFDYNVVFKRDFGRRKKTHTIRFTERGLEQLLDWEFKKYHGIGAEKWLEAIEFGYASSYSEQGIKHIKMSPIKALPHLIIRLKVMGPGERWLGFIDDQGRYVFDLFFDDHY